MSVEVGDSQGPESPLTGSPHGDAIGPEDSRGLSAAVSMAGGDMSSAVPFSHTPDFLLNVQLSVSVEVGRIQMPVRQVMELGPGAVIELQRSASEPVEIHANGRCIG